MLKVKGAPFVQKMEPMKVVAGKSMFVTCPVAGWPISSIHWEKGMVFQSISILFKPNNHKWKKRGYHMILILFRR